jgi:hypothetical protein
LKQPPPFVECAADAPLSPLAILKLICGLDVTLLYETQ